MTREELITSKEYLLAQLQLGLLHLIGTYKDENELKDKDLANHLGVSKGYVSQLLNATFDHKLSKVVDLSLACDKVPLLFFIGKNDYVNNDRLDKEYHIIPALRAQNVCYHASKVSNSLATNSIDLIQKSQETTSQFATQFCQ
jgi:transcriptional regulator with XRE-family HTH domain